MVTTKQASVVSCSDSSGRLVLIIGAGAVALALALGSCGFKRSEGYNPPAIRSREYSIEDSRIAVLTPLETGLVPENEWNGTQLEVVDFEYPIAQAPTSPTSQGKGPCKTMGDLTA